MAAALYAESGRESARSLAADSILCYCDLIKDAQKSGGRVHDDVWEYLQLVAVWVRHLLKDTALADSLVERIAHGKSFSFGMLLGAGKHGWGSYGYPNVSFMGSDFHILYPRNIGHRLSEGVRKNVKRWEGLLMNPDQLADTYERIRKIREPIRERLLKQLKKEKEERHQRRPAAKAEPSVADERQSEKDEKKATE